MNLDTPILIVIFNREEVTKKLFDVIKSVKPKKLVVYADGPRQDNPLDLEKCKNTRLITENIDWDCEVTRYYSEKNLGCDASVVNGIDLMFEKYDRGIILEDDCIPNLSFFNFCQQLLEKYSANEKVMHINGSSFYSNSQDKKSYRFSKYSHSWGWATWKRAWNKYDHKLNTFEEFKKINSATSLELSKKEYIFWINFFSKIHSGKYPFWDARWQYSIWYNKGVTITPNINLISNIGYGKDSTHTGLKEKIHNLETKKVDEFIHPDKVEVDHKSDGHTFKIYYHRSLFTKIIHKLYSILK